MRTAHALVAGFLVAATSSAAPPTHRALFEAKSRFRPLVDRARARASPEERTATLDRLLAEAIRQSRQLLTVDPMMTRNPDALLWSYSFLPVLTDWAKGIGRTDSTYDEVTALVARADRRRVAAARALGPVPEEPPALTRYLRRWAAAQQATLRSAILDLRLARHHLRAPAIPGSDALR